MTSPVADLVKRLRTFDDNRPQHSEFPWVFTKFSKPDGSSIVTVADVIETTSHSVRYSEIAALFGVALDDKDNDGFSTVVCYTGNGPRAAENARLIAAIVDMLAAIKEAADALEAEQKRSEAWKDQASDWETRWQDEHKRATKAERDTIERCAKIADEACGWPHERNVEQYRQGWNDAMDIIGQRIRALARTPG
jgi:hypothetical protein